FSQSAWLGLIGVAGKESTLVFMISNPKSDLPPHNSTSVPAHQRAHSMSAFGVQSSAFDVPNAAFSTFRVRPPRSIHLPPSLININKLKHRLRRARRQPNLRQAL